ncbi:MAG: KGK domain-containing protein [Lyngbya sp.]|nr:KGK domain-containing protein [Lyngbya sp.]
MDGNFNDGFQPLTCDEDVLLFGKDTFTVGKFRRLVLEIIKGKVYDYESTRKTYTILSEINTGFRVDSKVGFGLLNSRWRFCTQEVECQLLGVGYSGWKKGKLRINTDINLCPQDYIASSYSYGPRNPETIIKMDLEFCPDEPNEYQSPLDKLRQLESDLQLE